MRHKSIADMEGSVDRIGFVIKESIIVFPPNPKKTAVADKSHITLSFLLMKSYLQVTIFRLGREPLFRLGPTPNGSSMRQR